MTVEELIRKLRDVVLACPEAAQFPVRKLIEIRITPDGWVTAGEVAAVVMVNPLSMEVEID